MIRKKLQIINKLGVHARAAAKLVQCASKFQSQIDICKNGKIVNGKSIMGVMMLAASQDSWIELIITGADELNAMTQIEELILNKFGEAK